MSNSSSQPGLPDPASSGRYRYLIIVIGFVTLAGASGTSSLFSVFYSTLLDEFDWSHAAGASVYSVNMLVVAISAPLVGWLLDRYGPRGLYTAASILIGGAFFACSRLQNLQQYIIFYGVLSAFGQTALLSMTVVVARWFTRRHRGRAIGFADVGTGFGMVVLVPVGAWLISQFGWRTSFMVLGLVIMVVLVPLNLLHKPATESIENKSQTVSLSGLRLMLWDRSLWLLCVAHLFMTITMTMVNVHLVEFLVSTHILQIFSAATVISAVSLVSLPGRMFFGWLVDRWQPNRAFAAAMSCTIVGFVMLLLLGQIDARWPLIAFIVIYGFAQGAGGIAIAAKTVDLFHSAFLGTIFMVVTLSGNIGAAFGAWLGGQFFDLSGSYMYTFITAIFSGALAIILMWVGRAPAALLSKLADESSTQ